MKDYYSILQLPVTASPPEIKKAYRMLAMKYHPDKQKDDLYALAKFNDIKEAYEVLMNPGKKELYLQERWLSKASGKLKADDAITPPNILLKSLELNKQIALLDIHRMDYKGTTQRIAQLLNDEVLEQLLLFNEVAINETIIDSIQAACKPLPYSYSKLITERLLQLAAANSEKKRLLQKALHQKKKAEQFQKKEGLFIFLAVVIICMLIFLTGR